MSFRVQGLRTVAPANCLPEYSGAAHAVFAHAVFVPVDLVAVGLCQPAWAAGVQTRRFH